MGRRRMKKRANGEGSLYLRKDGRWAAEMTSGYDENGRQQRPRVYGRTQAEARAKIEELKKRLAQGLTPKPERQTVSQFLNKWLDTVCPGNVGEKTLRTYPDLLEDHVIPTLGRLELPKLSPEHVQQLLEDIRKKVKPPRKKVQTPEQLAKAEVPAVLAAADHYSESTVKACRDALRAALNVAMQWGLVTRNAAALAKLGKVRKRKPQFYDESQARVFWEAIAGDRLEAFFWLALCLGPREGELLGVGWDDFDFEEGTVQLLRSLQRIKRKEDKKSRLELVSTKTEDSDRTVRVPQIVLEKLRAHRIRQDEERRLAGSGWHETGMVFTTRKGTFLDPRNMLREYFRLRDRAHLPKIRFHDLRHSAATILKMGGVPDEAIQKLLGHASVRTTQEIYMHLTSDGEKRAADKMDEIFGRVAVKVAVKRAKKKKVSAASD
jgi:integrase